MFSLAGENDMYFVYEETTDDMGQVQVLCLNYIVILFISKTWEGQFAHLGASFVCFYFLSRK